MNAAVLQQQIAPAVPVEPEPGPWPVDEPIRITVTPSPNHGGNRAKTTGVVIHSTRSGQSWGLPEEFASTVNWFANPAAQVSAHAVVGGLGVVGFPVQEDKIGWHDPSTNATHLGIEVCQPTYDRPYQERQYGCTATLVKDWAKRYGFPLDRAHIVGHEETSSGSSQGKSDPGNQAKGGQWDWDRFFEYLLT